MWSDMKKNIFCYSNRPSVSYMTWGVLKKTVGPTILCTLVISYFQISVLKLPLITNSLHKPGLYVDILYIILLSSTHALVVLSPFRNRYLLIIRMGLLLWLFSAIFDCLDECIYQPIWMGFFVEDTLRLCAMFIVFYGILKLTLHLARMYTLVRYEAMSDTLTQLPNRRYFMLSLDSLHDDIYTLYIIDIDHFKAINDSWGHHTGDLILRQFGNMLSEFHSEICLPARIGGEEFAMIFRNSSPSQMEVFSKKIMSLSRNIDINNDINLSISIGGCIRRPGEKAEELLKRADEALYLAKKNGRGRAVLNP